MKKSDLGSESINEGRRRLLKMGALGTAGVAVGASAGGIILSPEAQAALPKVSTQARIVIAGAGAAGLSLASRLSERLDGAKITLIDARKAHWYQPGFTLVASGVKGQNYPVTTTAEYVPKNVELIEEFVAEFDPEGKSVTTASGKKLEYDYLLVTTGLKLDYEAIEGMDTSLIGTNGVGSIYQSPEAAFKTWQLLDKFADTGGEAVFMRPATEMKCAGAPLKYTFLTRDHLYRRGNLSKANLTFHAQTNNLFSVPIVSEKLRMLFEERGVNVKYNHVLSGIDPGRKMAYFNTQGEGRVEVPYDFINVVPPMRAADAVRNSSLPWQDGPWAADGWIEVDPTNLRHKRFPNIFAVGDVAGVPKGKTAASVKWQVPVVVDHLIADIQGKQGTAIYDGYTSCPMITQLGRAMLIEFDYHNNLVPSFPGVIAPLEELWVTWIIKTIGLKPTYISMLRGQA